jgi:hypothetical protein
VYVLLTQYASVMIQNNGGLNWFITACYDL